MPIRFQVDPDFYDHPKTIGMSDAAFALWVRAGSYSAAKLSDGFINEDALVHTLGYGTDVADELTRRGLWSRVKGGYRFRQWGERNLTRARVEKQRTDDRERKREERKFADAARKRRDRGALRDAAGQMAKPQVEPGIVRMDSGRNPDGLPPDSERNPNVSVSVSVSESVLGSGHGSAAVGPPGAGEPFPRCQEHFHDPKPPPCGACADARRAHEAWAAEKRARIDSAPKCRIHRGQLAYNCSGCRADAKGAA